MWKLHYDFSVRFHWLLRWHACFFLFFSFVRLYNVEFSLYAFHINSQCKKKWYDLEWLCGVLNETTVSCRYRRTLALSAVYRLSLNCTINPLLLTNDEAEDVALRIIQLLYFRSWTDLTYSWYISILETDLVLKLLGKLFYLFFNLFFFNVFG